ncbi:ribosomal protein L22/L17 [Paraphysoderma sedebokerense]|nr:ribosomal protein L22/L17 [Paraphysoderma sedebokerense]
MIFPLHILRRNYSRLIPQIRHASSNATSSNSKEAIGASSIFDIAVKEVQTKRITESLKTGKPREHLVNTGRIDYSPQKLNMLARQIKGLSVTSAIHQMQFSLKKPGPIIAKALKRGIKESLHIHNKSVSSSSSTSIVQPLTTSSLYIAQAWVGKEIYERGIRIMGRGRFGIMHKPGSHMKILLRESNEPLAPNRGNRWQGKGGLVPPKKERKKVWVPLVEDKPIYNKWKKFFYDA